MHKNLTRNRNLFNADCSTIFAYAPQLWQLEDGPFTAKAAQRFVDVIAQGGVDTLVINPNCQIPWYPSKVVPTMLTGYQRGDREFFRGDGPNDPDFREENTRIDCQIRTMNRYRDLEEAGVDWVAEMIASCRRHHVAPWSSVRMNDNHGAVAPETSSELRTVQGGEISFERSRSQSARQTIRLVHRPQLRVRRSARLHDAHDPRID